MKTISFLICEKENKRMAKEWNTNNFSSNFKLSLIYLVSVHNSYWLSECAH